MQLTRFDRWLREKLVYETHIQTLRLPEHLPAGIRAFDLPEKPGARFKHLFIAKDSRAADALITQLKQSSQMYNTRIVDREAWYVPLVAPKEKSVTWWLVSLLVTCICLFGVFLYLKGLLSDPEFRKNAMEALEILKG